MYACMLDVKKKKNENAINLRFQPWAKTKNIL